jgi:hypothetical protein
MPLGEFTARGKVAEIYEWPHASNLGALEAIDSPSCEVRGLRRFHPVGCLALSHAVCPNACHPFCHSFCHLKTAPLSSPLLSPAAENRVVRR